MIHDEFFEVLALACRTIDRTAVTIFGAAADLNHPARRGSCAGGTAIILLAAAAYIPAGEQCEQVPDSGKI
jgi:hypothetical protein